MASKTSGDGKSFKLSLDVWALIFAFALALLVRADIIKKIPW